MSTQSRALKRYRRFTEDFRLYRRVIDKRARRSLRKERGYLYVDTPQFYVDHTIWAHELEAKALIHKGRKP